MNADGARPRSGTLSVALVLLLTGCGGGGGESSAGEIDGEAQNRVSESFDPVSGSQPLVLDYGPRPSIAGFVRFEGSCTTFPYNFQHPEAWEMTGSRGMSVSNQLRDGSGFTMVIHADHGSMHVANLEEMVLAQGASDVGRVQVGGHDVRVLGMDGNYLLHTPHGPGFLFHQLAVNSEVAADLALRILETLEPLPDC